MNPVKDLLTVSEVSAAYGVPARMLRRYEKPGLLSGDRRENYADRVYHPEEVRRLHFSPGAVFQKTVDNPEKFCYTT